MMDSFYVTLPSNSSMSIYTKNNAERFKTVLPRRLKLVGDWEVALMEMHYPQYLYNININRQFLVLSCDTDRDNVIEQTIQIPEGVYVSVEHILGVINTLSQKGILQFTFELLKDRHVKYTCDFVDTKMDLSHSLALMLGFMPGIGFSKEERASSQPNLMLGLPKSMYVYMDIVAPQYVGDVMARLLRVVRVDIKKFVYGGLCTETFHNPHYVPLSIHEFQEVELDIRDDLGNPVYFLTGSTTVVLHFRRK